MKIYENITQASPEWFEIRKGKITASHAQAIGSAGKGLDTYIDDMMAETYSSGEKEQFTNRDTERGNEIEELAREMYELENNCVVQQVGFIEMDESVGCSPDGLVGEDGGLEIKSPKDTVFFKMILRGKDEIDTKYIWQVQMNLLITKRKWWDIAFYNPNYKKSLIVFRITPDLAKHAALLRGIELGKKRIEEIKKIVIS